MRYPMPPNAALTVVACDDASARCVLDAIRVGWPENHGEFFVLHLTAEEAREVGHAALDPFVVAALDGLAEISKLVDHLEEEHVPLAVVADEKYAGYLAERGVLWLPRDVGAEAMAGVICAMAHSSGTIHAVREEMFAAVRAKGGADGELQRLHDELTLAASVQNSFIPDRLPSHPSLDIGVIFRPASYVSGDIYSVRQLDDDRIAVLLADAVGHGVPAALLTMILTRAMASACMEGDRVMAPSEVLRRMNGELIAAAGDEPRFASAMYAVIDTRDRVVTIAGAGHPAALVVRGDGIGELSSTGGLLGVFPEDAFDDTVYELGAGETLILYSDGFETAFADAENSAPPRPSDVFVERFASIVRSAGDAGIGRAVQGLARELDCQAGSLHQADDLTALFISANVESALDGLMRGRGAGEVEQDAKMAADRAGGTVGG